jgi:hypothetical protein
MRTVVASALILFVVSVVALCPAIACPVTAASPANSGCCHKSANTGSDCPYSILAKSKTTPVATHAQRVGAIVQAGRSAIQPAASLTVEVPCRVADASGLFLRNCVLLI